MGKEKETKGMGTFVPLVQEFESLSKENQATRILESARKVQPILSQITGRDGFFITVLNHDGNKVLPQEKIGETMNPDEVFDNNINVNIGNFEIAIASPDKNPDLYSVAALVIAFGAKRITYDEASMLARRIGMSCLDEFNKTAERLSAPFLSETNEPGRFHE